MCLKCFGLARGNPVSAFVTFLQFVRPAILKMMGADDLDLPKIPAKIDRRSNERRRSAALHPRQTRTTESSCPFGRQESHALFGLSQSNALLRVVVGESLKADAIVDVQIWD